jgi:membrane protein YqaA with SNARE-associated domain
MLRLLLQTQHHGGHGSLASFARWGVGGLFVLAVFDSSPIPTFSGPDILTVILAASRHDLWWMYAAVATAGSVIGAYLTFRLARKAGQAYLDKKFKKGRVSKVLKVYRRWGTVALFASSAIPFPTPTGILFAAAGVSKVHPSKFLGIVFTGRALRYTAIAFLAALYGRHIIRVLRHPGQYWGWLLLLILIVAVLVTAFILLERHMSNEREEKTQERKIA